MNSSRILIVDDEKSICNMIEFALHREGYECWQAHDARSAHSRIANHHPDLILADWMLPDTSGIDLIRTLKRTPSTRNIPIIMISARSSEQDKVTGLENGAEDYVVKPFPPRELVARIAAVLRRVTPLMQAEVIDAGGLVLHRLGQRVIVGSKTLSLSATEFRMLEFLMTHPNRVYSRSQLLDRLWGNESYVDERTVDVHVMRLRKILSEFNYDAFIQTVRSAGYLFSTTVA